MDKALFDDLVDSLKEMKAVERGDRKPTRELHAKDILGTDAVTIRQGLGFSQPEFASLLGIQVGTLRNWEQGRRQPEGPARVLLCVAAAEPRALLAAAKVRFDRPTGAITILHRKHESTGGRKAAKKAFRKGKRSSSRTSSRGR